MSVLRRWGPVTVALLLLVVVRLAYLGDPAGRDEAGYLVVAQGWHSGGTSLYGDHWVDRPPLLICIVEAAGSVTGLRLVGLLASLVVVAGVAAAARLAAGRTAAVWAACTAALLGTAHWFGMSRTNGELLASAFVAAGLPLTLLALRSERARTVAAWAAGAGALAAGAVLVKQTILDGLVFAVALVAATAWQSPTLRRRCVTVLAAGSAGFLAALALALALAAARGTSPGDLFDALVVFRFQAGEVIRESATSATPERLGILAAIWLVSGLGVVSVATLARLRRDRDPVLVATAAVLVVVTVEVVLGGSYWAHYLVQLVPATSLAVGLLVVRLPRRPVVVVAAAVALATLANTVFGLATRAEEEHRSFVVGTWLRDSATPGDSGVVAFGQPNVLERAGLAAPYPYLWSLIVRTRDPELRELTAVMEGPDRPTWVVDWSGPRPWGLDAAAFRAVLERDYRVVATVCERRVWLERSTTRTLESIPDCR
ncbi:MAG: hypothetical protein EON52_00605 [Actinomycetales bacterium]|nr:MAG: hypothetical protein EON52_00605 [Actinomycetales bacterium]